MNWYIGQEIVCVKTHPERVVKESKIYTIKALRTSACKCKEVKIDVGAFVESGYGIYTHVCSTCGSKYNKGVDRTWWLSETRFRPID